MKQYTKTRSYNRRYKTQSRSKYNTRYEIQLCKKIQKQTQDQLKPNTFSELVFRGNDLSKLDNYYSNMRYYSNRYLTMDDYLYEYFSCNCIGVDFPNIDIIYCCGSINVFIPKTCTKLKKLCCDGCPNIIIEEGVNLEILECYSCPSIIIPNSCVNLKRLECGGCPNIIIPQTCVNLEDINCYGCPNLVIPKTCVNLKNIWYHQYTLNTYDWFDHYLYNIYHNEEINITIPKECTKIEWFPRGFEKQEKKIYVELLLEVTPLYKDVIDNIINFLVKQ
jgi:hypothetical protein